MGNPRLPAIDFRKLQRACSTSAEHAVWYVLRNRHLGAKFRRQATAGPYTLDFFCPRLRLAVEIDGSQHRDETGLLRDAARDAALAAAGIKVLRFTNQEALAATEGVAMTILYEVERLETISPKPAPGSSRRRDSLAAPSMRERGCRKGSGAISQRPARAPRGRASPGAGVRRGA